MVRPTLHTPRLTLRPFVPADAEDVRRLAGDEAIARNTLVLPHPYEQGMAEAWIATHEAAATRGEELVLAITCRETRVLLGTIGMRVSQVHRHGELGYWVGRPWWSQGVATEAARALLDHGFSQLGLERVWALHFRLNPASGRVLQKLGMRHEGCLRRHYWRFGAWHDVEVYGVLAGEWSPPGREPPSPPLSRSTP